MMVRRTGVAFALSLVVAAAHAESRFADDVAALRKIQYDTLPPHDPAPALKARFASVREKHSAAGEAQLADEDIRDYFDAAWMVAFWAHDRSSVEAMRGAFDALAQRGIASDRQRQDMLDAYVEARLVSEAMTFAREPANARLNPLPVFAPDDGAAGPPTLWRLTADGTIVERVAFTIGDAPRVLVVSSPWCGFSGDATAAPGTPHYPLSCGGTRPGSCRKGRFRISRPLRNGTAITRAGRCRSCTTKPTGR